MAEMGDHLPPVKLSAEAQKLAGLVVAHPAAAEWPREVLAYGQVMDPSPLAALDAEVATAEAALAASKATAERERGLFAQQQNISRKVLETSEAQFRADETKARTLHRRLFLEWGEALAELPPAKREALVEALAKGASAIVRVDVPAGTPVEENPSGARVALLGREDDEIKAASVSAAAAVDPKTQAQGFLLLTTDSPRPLRPGPAAIAHLQLPGEKLTGSLIPRSAVLRHEGKNWIYVKRADDEFERVEVALDHAGEQGWSVAMGFTPTENIVTTGAQLLLSEELKHQIAE
jgi:multidrug efflux system membrane fusion protein